MSRAETARLGNRLLDRLSGGEAEALLPHLERVSLAHAQPLIKPGEPISHVYFPVSALASLVTVMEDGSTVESGAVGREGMVGIPVLLDADSTTMETLVQIAGEAYRARAETIKRVYDRGGGARKLLNRYMHTVIVAGSQTAACNRLHHVEQRLCRWLLMSSDGVGSEVVPLTQEFLATMLGVRRAGVTEAAGKLQDEGLIRYSRGAIEILDRGRMGHAACECYRVVKEEFDRLLG